jgi:hypothetical protein
VTIVVGKAITQYIQNFGVGAVVEEGHVKDHVELAMWLPQSGCDHSSVREWK